MGIEFFDSFDSYSSNSVSSTGLLSGGYSTVRGSATSGGGAGTPTPGRFPESQGVFNYTLTGNWCAINWLRINPNTQFSVGVAYKDNGYPGSIPKKSFVLMAGHGDPDTEKCLALGITVLGEICVCIRTGAAASAWTILGKTRPNTVFLGQWNHYAFYGEIAASGSVGVNLNGFPVEELQFEGIDTRGFGVSPQCNYVSMGGQWGSSVQESETGAWDDIVIRDDSEPVPDARIMSLRPNADGANSGWTPSTGTVLNAMIDEISVDQTDYIQATSVGMYAEIGVADLPYVPDEIYSVAVRGYVSKSDAASRALVLGLKTGAGTIVNNGETGLSTSASPVRWQIDNDPDTAAPWLTPGVNALLLRPLVTV